MALDQTTGHVGAGAHLGVSEGLRGANTTCATCVGQVFL